MELEEEHEIIGLRPGLQSGPIVAGTVGRAMTTLLNLKPKKLQDAISRLNPSPNFSPITVSVEHSLCFLHKYIGEAVEKDDRLDYVLVPMLQHSLTMRDSKKGNQALILLNWLFQDEIFVEAILRNVSDIISRIDDHYVALGWCTLGRSLIEYENIVSDVTTNAIKQTHDVILKMFCSSIPHLLSIMCKGSIMQEGFELPTRLAVAAADFLLSLTVALTRKESPANDISKRKKTSLLGAKNQPSSLHAATVGKNKNAIRETSEVSSTLDMKLLLWNSLNELINLVKKLTDWSRKSRYLHAEGLKRVYTWLQELKKQYDCFQEQTELHMMKTGSLLLSSCWKHYGMLMCLEDRKFSKRHKELLDQYLSGIKIYADNQAEEPDIGKSSKLETVNFFLNCLMLLLGRLDIQQFANAVTESGPQISEILISQLQCADKDVIDGAINIFKAVIFNKTNHTLSRRSLDDVRQIDAFLPTLLTLLDERDSAAKAIVKLLAEYCSICSNGKCLNEVLKRIRSKNVVQRRNAVDVVADLIHITSGSGDTLSEVEWQDVANHLLECLGDENEAIQNQAANLIPIIGPHLVLPRLTELSYSPHENIQSSATIALIALLVNHKEEPDILCMLLDCLSKLAQNTDSGAAVSRKAGSTVDTDRLFKLLPDWAKQVEDWHVIVGPLVDKMLAEPSNAVIVRFLSQISEYVAKAVDLVFNRLILYMREQNGVNECFSECKRKIAPNSEALNHEYLFIRLCPLLVIRLLPLRVFDDLNSSLVYGQNLHNSAIHETRHFITHEDTGCIAALVINRALSKSEFEEVRKLAAELCGRLHPEVLIPILSSQLESAANAKDTLKIKACLFSLCTCLMVRGNNAYTHPDLLGIRKTIETVLSWVSTDGDEISKAQHGCIDSLALMLCTELQAPDSSKGTVISSDSILAYVINQLTESNGSRLTFRLCMANVLISSCQKIPDSGKKSYAKRITPRIIRSIKVMADTEMRAACIQVLFTVAYHLKSFILPYSHDLLTIALSALKQGSQKEKMGGAKLLMCLMASEEEVVESISARLLEAVALLTNLSSTDPSAEVRQMCQQLLCLTSLSG